MQAGKLRHRLTIQKKELVRDAAKLQHTTQPVTVCEVWGSVEPLNGSESTKADQEVALATHRVVIRWRAGIEPQMEVLFRGRTLGIESVLNIEERDRKLELMCVESA
jgi:SPP1 family predicted phage head-tail adaptor